MQPVTQDELERIIEDARKQGKDVSELERDLEAMKSAREITPPVSGQKAEKQTPEGTVVIESTGPDREDDF